MADSAAGLPAQFAPMVAANAGLTGVQLLADAPMALAVRLLLVHRAQSSIDVQYYIWEDDASGLLLLEALVAAANRGVRVRLLLDDLGCGLGDARLALLHSHPSLDVRLFNPFKLRWPRWINLVFDFSRLNRRMHNKSITVDACATVIGGRNIGDNYFVDEHPALAADLDVLAVGEIVGKVCTDFERYWCADAAVPVDSVITRPRASRADADSETLRRRYQQKAVSPETAAMIDEIDDFVWAPVLMMSDDPDKVLGRAGVEDLILPMVLRVLAPVKRLLLVSAYFVPMEEGAAGLEALAAKGVVTTVLTNSFRSTDVALVHAGYAPARARLLRAGVALWEMRGRADDKVRLGLVPKRLRRPGDLSGGTSFFRKSASGLHAKTFCADGLRLFVGSINFDPRSWRLNTEIGFLIESAVLAGRVERQLMGELPDFAWGVDLEDGHLVWREGDVVLRAEPGTRWWQRAVVWLIGKLPIAGLL